MAGLIPPLRPGSITPGPAKASPSVVDPAKATEQLVPDTRGDPGNPPSIRNRLQTLFGWATPSNKTLPVVGRFSQAEAVAEKPSSSTSLPSTRPRDHTERLGDQPERRQFTAPASELRRPLSILDMLEKNNNGTSRLQGTDSPSARSWKSLAQTSIGLEFERNVTELEKQKSQQLTALQAGIAQLPPDLSLRYQALLSDIVAYRTPAERDTMLTDLARDVAARLRQLQ